jgi:hypothetical protein
MTRANSSIGVDGIKGTMRALEAFAPEINKRLKKDIRRALNDTKIRAQAKYPNGAYSVVINRKKPLGSVMASAGRRIDDDWGASDDGVRAAIFEFAGSNQEGRTPQARGLIKSLNTRYGQPGRFLWAAWDETGKDVLDRIRTSMLEAERDLQRKLDAEGQAY